MAKTWTFENIEEAKELPDEAYELRYKIYALWMARLFIAEASDFHESEKETDPDKQVG